MKRWLYLFLIVHLIIINICAQQSEVFCGFSLNGGLNKTNDLAKITSVPHSGTFRILVVLCKFSDDNSETLPITAGWPKTLNTMPSWGNSVVSATVQPSYTHPSISGYFDVMSVPGSANNLDIIGDEYFYQPQNNENYYWISSGRHIGYLIEEILTNLDPSINYGNYDNDNDGTVDMILVCFREANFSELDGRSYQGIADLNGFQTSFGTGTTLTLDGKTISSSSGIVQRQVYDLHSILGVSAHELGHYLFGAVHFEGIGHHGMMDGAGTGIMCSFEREKLGWITPQVVTDDLINESITDALSTNDVYKIPFPGSTLYYLVDNHLRQNYYESDWRKYQGGPLISPGTGVLITFVYSFGSSVDVVSAFGSWNWQRTLYTWSNPSSFTGWLYTYPYVRLEAKRHIHDYGEDKLDLRNKVDPSDHRITLNHGDYLGSQDDYFTLNTNKIFAAWTNPSSSFDANNNTNVSVVLKGTTTVDFYVDDIIITENITFPSETYEFIGNLIIPKDITLNLQSNTTLKFVNGKSLIIENGGSLIVNGSASSPVTFNFVSPNSTTENGIKFNSGSSGSINYCIVRNAYRGIYENGVNVNISNTAISNCIDGIYLNNSNQARILQCNIHNNSNTGINLMNSSPFIEKNYIEYNSTGVNCLSNSSPVFGNGSIGMGNNIRYNTDGVVSSTNTNTPRLGNTLPTVGGYNNLVNYSHNVVNSTPYTIYARNNWWGSTNPANFLILGGNVTYSPYRPSQETIDQPPLSKSNENFASINDEIPMLSELDKAYQLVDSKKYKEAREICLKLVNNYPDYSVSFNALNILKETYIENELEAKKNIFETFVSNKSRKEIYAIAGVLLSDIDKDNKIKHLDNVLNNYKEGAAAELAMFNKFVYYYFDLEDLKNARLISKQLDERFPKSDASIEAHKILGDEEYFGINADNKQVLQKEAVEVPKEFMLYDNYPNPFNPSTVISYQLPVNSFVTLKIYDALGREIISLAEESKTAGYYEAAFDGSNMASGTYIYRLTANSLENGEQFVKSAKMMLVK